MDERGNADSAGLTNSPQDVDRSGGGMGGGAATGSSDGTSLDGGGGGSDGRGSLAEDGSAGSRGFGQGSPDGDAGLQDTVAGSGLGRPDRTAGVEAHRDDDPEDGGSPGMSTELRPANTTAGAGDPGSLDSKSSASGGGPTPTIKGD